MPDEFDKHNDEVRKVWDAFAAGSPTRVPVIFALAENVLLLDARLNPKGVTFADYCRDPDVMMQVQLELQKWIRLHVWHDMEMGLPADGWAPLYVDFQNTAEAAWMGCPITYGDEGSVPDTTPILQDDKQKLRDLEIPDPVHGNIMGTVYDYWKYLTDKIEDYEFEGLPIRGVVPVAHMTDGPFTLAGNLRGITELCLDIYEDGDFVHELMTFVTDALIARGKAWYPLMGVELPMEGWMQGFGDDSAELLSVESYRQFVLPYHRRLTEAFGGSGPCHIHMCGRAQHLFKTMQAELNMQDFYVGYFCDLGKMRRELGPDVMIEAGVIHPTILRDGDAGEIRDEVKRGMTSGGMTGGRLKVGTCVAPGTPAESLRIAYDAGREYGRYA